MSIAECVGITDHTFVYSPTECVYRYHYQLKSPSSISNRSSVIKACEMSIIICADSIIPGFSDLIVERWLQKDPESVHAKYAMSNTRTHEERRYVELSEILAETSFFDTARIPLDTVRNLREMMTEVREVVLDIRLWITDKRKEWLRLNLGDDCVSIRMSGRTVSGSPYFNITDWSNWRCELKIFSIKKILALQPQTTITEWLKEKGIASPIGSTREDYTIQVLRYYSGYHKLFVPFTGQGDHITSFSDTPFCIFYFDDIVTCIMSWCRPYTLTALKLVNKQLNNLIPVQVDERLNNLHEVLHKVSERPNKSAPAKWKRARGYAHESIRDMDWWHIADCLKYYINHTYDCSAAATRRGYRLFFHKAPSYMYPRDSELVVIAAEHSDGSERYFNLIKDIVDARQIKLSLTGDEANRVIDGSIRNNDERIFKWAHSHYRIDVRVWMHAAYYGRVSMLMYLLSYDITNEDRVEEWRSRMDAILVHSYIGGHYNEMSEFSSFIEGYRPPTPEKLIQQAIGLASYPMTSPSLLIDLVKQCSNTDINEVVAYALAHVIGFDQNSFNELISINKNVNRERIAELLGDKQYLLEVFDTYMK